MNKYYRWYNFSVNGNENFVVQAFSEELATAGLKRYLEPTDEISMYMEVTMQTKSLKGKDVKVDQMECLIINREGEEVFPSGVKPFK